MGDFSCGQSFKLKNEPGLKNRTNIFVNNLMDMLTFCVRMTIFQFNSDKFRQEDCLIDFNDISTHLELFYA